MVVGSGVSRTVVMTYLNQAVDLLLRGEVVAARTDTVYGLLADATNDAVVRKVFELKKRPLSKALILLVDSIDMAKQFGLFSPEAERLAAQFWLTEKSAVTLVVPAGNVSNLVTGGLETVAIRLPNDEFCLSLINKLGRPVVAPSANVSGQPTAVSYDMVRDYFGDSIPLIIDGGICSASPSRILDLTGAEIKELR